MALLPLGVAQAASCTSTTDGDWGQAIWLCSGGELKPGPGDTVFVDHIVTLTNTVSIGDLSISETGLLESEADLELTGDFNNNGTFDPATYTVRFTGESGDQMINGDGDLRFNDLVIANRHDLSGGWVILQELIELEGAVAISPNGALDLQGGNLGYASTTNPLDNQGLLRVSFFMDGQAGTLTREFPNFNATGYRGVEITTDELLGNVTVIVQGGASECTDDPGSVQHAARCFTITRDQAGSLAATVRLWALTSELNGIPETDLAPYRFDGSAWSPLGAIAHGNDGGDYTYGEGTTTAFSSFLLGDAGEAPTAVRIVSLTARPTGPRVSALLPPVLGLLAALSAWTLHRRASTS